MNPWIAKAAIVIASIVMLAIRAPHERRSRGVTVAMNRTGRLEPNLALLEKVGSFLIPLIWIASPLFAFADHSLRPGPFLGGVACFGVGFWLFYRSHADLGTNWSASLQVRDNHRLVASGVYRRIRHPMYAAFFLHAFGQLLVVPNWVAGPSALATFVPLFAHRLHVEEQMMVAKFGADYATYVATTKRVIPGVW